MRETNFDSFEVDGEPVLECSLVGLVTLRYKMKCSLVIAFLRLLAGISFSISEIRLFCVGWVQINEYSRFMGDMI